MIFIPDIYFQFVILILIEIKLILRNIQIGINNTGTYIPTPGNVGKATVLEKRIAHDRNLFFS